MRQVRGFLARIAGLFRGPNADDDAREEMQAHLEREIADNIRRGMRPEEVLRLLKSDVFERAGILCFRVEQCPESGAMNRPGFTGELVVQ